MKDNMEKFIKENREAFDKAKPSNDLFDYISQKVDEKRKGKTITFTRGQLYRVAAAILIPIFISYFIIGKVNQNKIDKITLAAHQNETEEMSPLLRELIESENYYSSMIDERTQEIFQLLGDQPELIQEISNMLSDIDHSYQRYNLDLNENVNSEEVMNALVNCQREKLQTLEDIYNQINP
jgi:hypothetical protein